MCIKSCISSLSVYNTSNFNRTRNSTYNLHNPVELSKIEIHGSKLSPKSNIVFRVYYKNINGLNTDIKSWKFSQKYRYLKYLQKQLDIDLISLMVMQVNLLQLDTYVHKARLISIFLLQLDTLYNISQTLFESDQFLA